jgi:hypothetical protein
MTMTGQSHTALRRVRECPTNPIILSRTPFLCARYRGNSSSPCVVAPGGAPRTAKVQAMIVRAAFRGRLAGNGISGSFNNRGTNGNFWSSSQSGGSAWNRNLNSDNAQVNRNANDKTNGLSVRCVKDSSEGPLRLYAEAGLRLQSPSV